MKIKKNIRILIFVEHKSGTYTCFMHLNIFYKIKG